MQKNILMKAITFMVITLPLLTAQQHATASRIKGSGFEATYESAAATLSLSGVGVLKYLGFIRIYNGALYLPPGIEGREALTDVPKRLEVEYPRSFAAEDFGKATLAGMRKNLPSEMLLRLAPKIELHNRLYPDIEPGDRVSLTYIPDAGTRIAVNGVTKGTIAGADFAKALFSLWLGDHPFDTGFKRDLLGH